VKIEVATHMRLFPAAKGGNMCHHVRRHTRKQKESSMDICWRFHATYLTNAATPPQKLNYRDHPLIYRTDKRTASTETPMRDVENLTHTVNMYLKNRTVKRTRAKSKIAGRHFSSTCPHYPIPFHTRRCPHVRQKISHISTNFPDF
jgi:hypothetical protein